MFPKELCGKNANINISLELVIHDVFVMFPKEKCGKCQNKYMGLLGFKLVTCTRNAKALTAEQLQHLVKSCMSLGYDSRRSSDLFSQDKLICGIVCDFKLIASYVTILVIFSEWFCTFSLKLFRNISRRWNFICY